MLRVALVQMNSIVGSLEYNQDRIVEFIKMSKKQTVDVVVTPELALTGYPPEDLLHKAHFVSNNLKALNVIKKATKGITAIVGFVDRDTQGLLYNAAAICSDGKVEGVYHKSHLPNYSVFDEHRYFVEGEGFKLVQCGHVLLGINICEDIWIEDGVCQDQKRKGAKILINLSSSPYELQKIKQRQRIIQNVARNLGCYVCYANLVGGQDELVFDGGSMIVDPTGVIVTQANQFVEDLLIYDFPIHSLESGLSSTESKHINVLPPTVKKNAVSAKIVSSLDSVEELYQALVVGTRDYVLKNKFQRVVIGLSGGIDSALVACIAVKALGRGNVVGVSMPSKFSSTGTKNDAKQLAENLGIEFHEIPIWSVYQAFLKPVSAVSDVLVDPDLAQENLQARIRGTLLMTLSNKHGWLVLTTGNKSEMAVGYCTLYGDMSGGFAVIKDILKTKVFELCRHINASEQAELIPKTILLRPPSAELRSDQKDEDSLPPYELLDKILIDYIEEHKSLNDIASTPKERAVAKEIIRLVDRSEYKRRQAPPGIKVSRRSFGKDWRLPITNLYREI